MKSQTVSADLSFMPVLLKNDLGYLIVKQGHQMIVYTLNRKITHGQSL